MLMGHHEREEAATLAQRIAKWCQAQGHDVWAPDTDIGPLGLPADLANGSVDGTDLVVSLGGDGTVLRAVDLVGGRPVPILAVNVGVLGYLTEVEPAGVDQALERWQRGDYSIEERMLLSVTMSDRPERFLALNEVVIEKAEPGHTVRLGLRIDGVEFTTYAADGMIVATPTGSTAYSLSARGPIVSPAHRAVLVTPVSPHMLFDRSLVLNPSEPVDVEVIGHRAAQVAVDGRGVALLGNGGVVRAVAAEETARFVRLADRRFHQILKAKFGLADR